MSTIADVARLAGVSAGTVSRVMNGATNVTPETRLRVEKAIADLGYQPNLQARSLRNKRTDTIALAIPELTNYFWTTVARGVQDAAQANNYHVFICNTYTHSRQNLRYLESIYSRVDGMILSRRSEWLMLTGGEQTNGSAPIGSSEKPVVFVGQSQAATWNVDNVYSDSVSGAFALTKHLAGLGRRDVAIVTGRQSSASASDRVAGYCMALADAHLPIDRRMICWGEYERKAAERLTLDLLERVPGTDAIVAANNEIAIGVVQALEKRRVAIPDEVAVVCFDDFYPDSRFASLMTVASQSPYDIGVNAAQLLLKRLLNEDHLRPQTIVLPARLIVRQSCGGVPSAIQAHYAFDMVQGRLIAPLPKEKLTALAEQIRPVVEVPLPPDNAGFVQVDKSQVTLLKQVLTRSATPGLPLCHFEYALLDRTLYRYVLEREPETEVINDTVLIVPEDQVEFAQRTGMAVIPCRLPYRLPIEQLDSKTLAGEDIFLFDFPALTEQLNLFDRYIHAARTTPISIAADFRSLFADTLAIAAALRQPPHPALLHKIADSLFSYYSKVVQLICDRFAAELAFVIFSDALANEAGLRVSSDVFEAVFAPRIQQLILPAREHCLPTVLYTPGKIDSELPLIRRMGFDAVYIAQPEANDLKAIKRSENRLAFMGAIPHRGIQADGEPEWSNLIRERVALLGAEGYVPGLAGDGDGTVPIKPYIAYLRALSISTS